MCTSAEVGWKRPADLASPNQLDSVKHDLLASQHIPTVLFMLNNPNGSHHFVKIFGKERVQLGFPGAGGTRHGRPGQLSRF
jgi:hypothetical protein